MHDFQNSENKKFCSAKWSVSRFFDRQQNATLRERRKMGINLSKKEKPAFQYFDQVLDRLIQQSEEVNLDKKNLQKKIFRTRKIREFEPGEIICKEGETGPVFMLLSGKLKIGDVFKFRQNDIICGERLFGLGSFFEISAEETSEIWQLTRTNVRYNKYKIFCL